MSLEHLGLMIQESFEKHSSNIAMSIKIDGQWITYSYSDFKDQSTAIAKALIEYGISQGEMVGIFADNMPQWSMVDFGIHLTSGVSVPIYATNTAKQAEYIVNDAKLKIVFAGNQDQYDKVKSFIGNTPHLEKIIAIDESIKIDGDKSLYLKDFIETGKASSHDGEIESRLKSVTTDDLATLIYTSGTTGDPKGVMLSHGSMCHQLRAIDEHFNVGTEDRSLCFLPLSHAYERTWTNFIFRQGANNTYLSNPKEIVETMPEVRPTCMVSVPRLYEKIYSTVYDRLEKASGTKKALFGWAVKVGKKYAYKKKENKFVGPYLGFRHSLADKLVLSKIRDVVGGPKNFFSAGGAALAKEIEEFFFAAGLIVCQGYGLSETAPLITCNRPGDFKFGTVGKAVVDCELKIGDDGEILFRGPNLMKGYYNKPQDTSEAIENGWFHTGDVGVIDEEGFLRITDRIKDLIITSGGKNIAPQHIESSVGIDHYIEQIATIGDKQKYISALIVPAFEALEEYAKSNGIEFSTREELVKHPDIIKFYGERIEAQSDDLAQYEKIKKFSLLANDFTQEGGELTPTMKIKRKIVAEKYKDVISSMYPQD